MGVSAASPASSFKGTCLILGSRVLESHFRGENERKNDRVVCNFNADAVPVSWISIC